MQDMEVTCITLRLNALQNSSQYEEYDSGHHYERHHNHERT